MSTVADELLRYLARMTPSELDDINELWRRQKLAVQAYAETLLTSWRTRGSRSAAAEFAGDSRLRQAAALRAMDEQLATVGPDTGDPGAVRRVGLSAPEAVELRRRWDASGVWAQTDRGVLLPARRGNGKLEPVRGPIGPLVATAAVLGDNAGRLRVTRLNDVDELRDWSPLKATDCAVAPLVGAAELTLEFSRTKDGARYRGTLDQLGVADETLDVVIASASTQGARILLLPEYALTPELYERWLAALKRANGRAPDLLVLGSGPVEDTGNTAVMVTAKGVELGTQPKTVAFDVAPHELDAWLCPTYGPFADEDVAEDIVARVEWTLFESRTGRIAIAVCESFKAQLGDSATTGLAHARPTLLLCPVLSKPLDKRSTWERYETSSWGRIGVDTVVANSVVVGEWMAGGAPTSVPCALWRTAGSKSTHASGMRTGSGGLDVVLLHTTV